MLYYEKMFQEFLAVFDEIEENNLDLYEVIKVSFEFFEKRKDKTDLLIKNRLTHLMLNEFSIYITLVLNKAHLLNNLTYFQLKFIEGGLYATLFDWTIDNQELSPEQIARDLLVIIN